jgi:hypothetical protein
MKVRLNGQNEDLGTNPSTEPAVGVGVSTASVAGILSLIALFFPNLLTDKQSSMVLVVAAFALPLVTAFLTRGKVWSPSSVEQAIENAVEDALAARKTDPDKLF